MYVCSLTEHFNDSDILLSELNISFDNLELRKIHQAQLIISYITTRLNIPKLNCQLVEHFFT